MKRIIIIALLALSVAGCRAIKEVQQEHSHEARAATDVRERRDSVHVYSRDSIFMLVKGDTVLVDRWHIRYHDRLVVRIDSIVRIDSVVSEVRVTEVVQPTKWQVFWGQLGKILAALIAVYIAFKIGLKWLKK
jgi:hypothetical protein